MNARVHQNITTVLQEIVTNITTGKERSWVEPCNFFPYLVCKADFPAAPCRLCSAKSCHYEKGGTQYPTDNIHPFPAGPYPRRKRGGCCNVFMSKTNTVSASTAPWAVQTAHSCLSTCLGIKAGLYRTVVCKSWSSPTNFKSFDVHIFQLSRQLDVVWLDPEVCQRFLQSGVLKLVLSTTGVLGDGGP